MKVTYIGAHDAVLVPLPSGAEVLCESGSSIDVPDEFAARLLEQEANWRLASSEIAKVSRAERKAEERAEEAEAARAADDGHNDKSASAEEG